MADDDRTQQATEAPREDARTEDPRRPYEAPKLVKKRSVARATLVTGHGPTNAITNSG